MNRREALFLIISMTVLMGLILSAVFTWQDDGFTADFIASWLARFAQTYLIVLPTVLLVSPIAQRIAGSLDKFFATDAVVRDRTDNGGLPALGVAGPVLLVNLFTPKPDMEQAFIDAQTAEYVRLRGQVGGSIGNRLGRAADGSGQLVNVALFDSMASYNSWRSSALFAQHLEIIRPFVERSEPGMYELIYAAGDL